MAIKNAPWVLGISASFHNGAACLLRGDEIIMAIQEERLVRKKRAPLFGAYPSRAIQYCFEYAGIQPKDLSMIVSCVTNQAKAPEQDLSYNPILQVKQHKIPIHYIPHHYGHAFSAFATSGFEESAVLVIDGAGSSRDDLTAAERAAVKWKSQKGLEAVSLYAASGVSIKPLEKHLMEPTQRLSQWIGAEGDRMPEFWSLGGMYHAAAVQIFGDGEAGKVMGLAPYGRPEIDVSEFFTIDNGRFVFSDKVLQRFIHIDRWPLRQEEYSILASSTQAALEVGVMYLVKHLYELRPSENFCYAGGVALNCIVNERIIRESAFKNFYFMPAAEDCGTSIGAAYYGLWQLTKTNTRRILLHDAVGPIYPESQIDEAIESRAAVETIVSEDVISDAVDLLCDGKIIGWLDGRSELGPRALGQRSILCDPRRPESKDVMNNRVKHRESFRPFAPVVLAECARDWFELDGVGSESPFMMRICKFKDGMKEQVPGVVHIDDTGRLQTITPEANGRLYLLVKKFYEKTGVPIILNTSFNVAGEPIIETPGDALNTFLSTGIDYCVLGDRIVGKRRKILFEEDEVPWPQRMEHQLSAILNPAIDGETVGAPPTLERPPSFEDYLGIYEHDIQGVVRIERDGDQLKAITMGGLVSWPYGHLSLPIKPSHQNVFEVVGGPVAGTRIVFFPDIRGHINLLTILSSKVRGIREVYFRQPEMEEVDCSRYEQFVGEYAVSDKRLVIEIRDIRLIASTPGQPGFELRPGRGNEFVLNRVPGYAVEFMTDASGKVTMAVVVQPNNVITLKRR